MIKRCLVVAGLLVIFSVSAGRTETAKSRLELDYGTSHNLQKFNQILNPDAEKNVEPVYGLDGAAANDGMNQYRKSFAEPAKTQDFEFDADTK